MGAQFYKNPVQPAMSMYSFLSTYSFFWKLYELTGDPAYVQIIFKENDNRYNGLPYDIFENKQEQFQQKKRAREFLAAFKKKFIKRKKFQRSFLFFQNIGGLAELV